MREFDADSFLNTPIYSLDFTFMIGDVKDFLTVSESSIDALYRQERRALDERGDVGEEPPVFRAQLEESTEYRFKVSLPLRVRYGALISLVTSVEWASESLNESASVPVIPASQRSRRAVSILEGVSERTGALGKERLGISKR